MSAWGRIEDDLQHQAGLMGVSKAPLWVKNGPCYLSKTDEFCIEWANRYALFCVSGRYRHLCQIAGGSQYQVARGVRYVANAQAEITA